MAPLNAAADVAVDSALTAVFSEAMDAATITASTFTLSSVSGPVTGTVSYSSQTNTATFTPAANLSSGATYTATVTNGAKDVTGNPMTISFSWSFNTRDVIPPTVTAVSPVNGSAGAATNSAVTAAFSEAMDPASINGSTFTLSNGISTVSGTVAYNAAASSATFTPSAALDPASTYSAVVTTGVKDSSGNAMTSNFTWSFTTGTTADTTAPTIISRSPETGATGVSLRSAVTATFSEAMSASTANITTFVLSAGTTAVEGTVAFDPASRTATFTPLGSLLPNVTYIATITTAVRDSAGNAMAANEIWTFTTAAGSRLTVTKTGTGEGTVTSSPAGIDCGATCSATYSGGSQVTLTAAPEGSSRFSGWSGGGCSGTGGCTVTLNEDTPVTALFTAVGQIVLKVKNAGAGNGTVKVLPVATASCGSGCYIYNLKPKTQTIKIQLTARPASGSKFTGWTGDFQKKGLVLRATLLADKVVTANFGEPRIALSSEELDFGDITRKQSKTMSLTISNTGDAPVVIKKIAVGGANAAMFKILDKGGVKSLSKASLQAGEAVEARIKFKAAGKGIKTTTINILSDDSHGPVKNINLTATVIPPVSTKKTIGAAHGDYVTREDAAVSIIEAVKNGLNVPIYLDDADGPSMLLDHLSDLNGPMLPGDLVTNEELAAIIVTAMEGAPEDDRCAAGQPYPDVSADSPLCGYIQRLSELGLAAECPSGFCPGGLVSRETLSHIAERISEVVRDK